MHAGGVRFGGLPVDSQIGTVGVPSLGIFGIFFPLYNIETRPDQAGLLGFIVPLTGSHVCTSN